jgi:SsrA-binding protein
MVRSHRAHSEPVLARKTAPRPTAAAKNGAERPHAAEPNVDNRRARFEFSFFERFEAGLALTGTEIKSIRGGHISLAEAYARVRDGELWLVGAYIAPYKEASWTNHEPRRARKLLLHRGEIDRLAGRMAQKGLTIVPLRLYFKRGKVKVEIGLASRKKLWDKRRTIKDREAAREMAGRTSPR